MLPFGVHTHSCLDKAILFQVLEVKLLGWVLKSLTLDAWKEDLRVLDQLIYKFLVEWMLVEG